ncbi:MAG TPA: hypothetical protein VGG33_03160, partial [Polyangia bacterium]
EDRSACRTLLSIGEECDEDAHCAAPGFCDPLLSVCANSAVFAPGEAKCNAFLPLQGGRDAGGAGVDSRREGGAFDDAYDAIDRDVVDAVQTDNLGDTVDADGG